MKRALITSGGGAKGAFTVGALKYLRENGRADFSIISGTSTGSLIAILVAAGEFNLLRDIYGSVSGNDILGANNLPTNVLSSKPFLYDPFPLENFIRTKFTDAMFDRIMQSNIVLCLNAISLRTGRLMVFSTKPIPIPPQHRALFFNPLDGSSLFDMCQVTTREQLIDAMMASVSQAGFMKPRVIEWATGRREQFVDGGNKEVAPTRIVVALDADEAYVLSNNPTQLFEGKTEYKQLFQTILRAIEIFIQDVRENDLAILFEYLKSKGAPPPFVICPPTPPGDLDPDHPTGLNFIPAQMANWQIEGFKAARKFFEPQV